MLAKCTALESLSIKQKLKDLEKKKKKEGEGKHTGYFSILITEIFLLCYLCKVYAGIHKLERHGNIASYNHSTLPISIKPLLMNQDLFYLFYYMLCVGVAQRICAEMYQAHS